MLRLLLVVEPHPDHSDRVGSALAPLIPSALCVAPGGASVPIADLIAERLGLTATAEARLSGEANAIAFVEQLVTDDAQVAGGESVVVALAGHDVVSALVLHALAAPIAAGRLRFDAGAIAEIEVRADAPWTVNRLNDGCHLDESHI